MRENNIQWAEGFETPPQSYWIASTFDTNFPSLENDIKVDVAIVGGGMAGITSAFLLKEEGLKVAVIEASQILKGTTGHTTAKITSQHGLIYAKIKSALGEEKAQQYAQANEFAIQAIENIVKTKNIQCDFHRSAAYIYTHQEKYVQKIEQEVLAASSLGIKASYHEEIPLPFNVNAAMRFDNQARFHPRKYLLALADEIVREGNYIFEQTRAINIEEGTTCNVITVNGKKVSAPNVIIATHYPFYDGYGMYFTRLYPERSYVLGIKIKGQFPEGMFITAEDPGRSLRQQEFDDTKIVLVGGEHHKTGQGEDMNNHYLNLKRFSEETFEVESVLYRWSTQDYSTPDEIPYAGLLTSNTPNIYVATGFRKWGMTNSTAAAFIIKDLITKGKSPWEDVYKPYRFTPAASAMNFIKENVNVAKELVSGKLAVVPKNVEIKPGEAKVVEVDGQNVGAYRDENGKLHTVSTKCTHMRCELRWNSAEKTWDCPCHGSRFTYDGEIIESPALTPLEYTTKDTL